MKWYDLSIILLIAILTTIVWSGVLSQIISGEGYYYFSPNLSFLANGTKGLLTDIDNFPRFIYFLQEKVFGGNLDGYMVVMFGIIVLINVSIYLLVKKITGSFVVGFLSALFGGINYISNYQFYARGHYQWFMQRVPELFPVLLGFYFLYLFLEKRKNKFFIFSLIFYSFAMFMSYYTTLSLPFFMGIIISFAIFKQKNTSKVFLRIKKSFKTLILIIPFIFITYLFNASASLGLSLIRPGQTLLQSIFINPEIIQKISYQLVIITVPFEFKILLSNFFDVNLQTLIFDLIIPVYVIYLFVFFYLFKIKSNKLILVFGLFIAILGHLFLNVYLRRINVYTEIYQGRYFYKPSIYMGIIFACFIYDFLRNLKLKTSVLITLVLLIASGWIFINTKYIWRDIRDSQYHHDGGKFILKHLAENKDKLPEGAFVFLPQPLMPLGEDFLKKYYSGKNTQFFYIDSNWQKKIPNDFDKSKVFVFDFDTFHQRIGKSNVNKASFVDRSSEYRVRLSD